MTLLTIATRVTDEVGLTRPNSVVNGTSQLERQLFALANSTLEELGRKDWISLEESYSFETVAGQEAYTLPNDFKKIITDTAYVASQYYQLRGSLTASEWAWRRSGFPGGTGRYRFRVMGEPKKIYLTPVPQLEETLVLEYRSVNLARATDNSSIPLFFSDSDEPRVPEELVRMGLKWRIKHAKGLDYSEDYNNYYTTLKELRAEDLSLGSQPVAVRSYAETPELGEGYVPETGYGF